MRVLGRQLAGGVRDGLLERAGYTPLEPASVCRVSGAMY